MMGVMDVNMSSTCHLDITACRFCNLCGGQQLGATRDVITETPEVVVMQLKRFLVDGRGCSRKNYSPIMIDR